MRSKVRSTNWPKSGDCSSRAERLTAILGADFEVSQRIASAQAVSKAQRPMPSRLPDSSATDRKAPGASSPRVGCCQRSSASAAMTLPDNGPITGW